MRPEPVPIAPTIINAEPKLNSRIEIDITIASRPATSAAIPAPINAPTIPVSSKPSRFQAKYRFA
jgi:hypothetical protein